MITKTMQGYPWNRIDVANPLRLRLSEALLDVLPHGSGINGSWYIDHPKTIKNRFYAHNTYEAMNENGFYCHNYRFNLTIDFIPESIRKTPCRHCDEKGIRLIKDLMEYHPTMTEIELIEWLEQRLNVAIVLFADGYGFDCNFCRGKRYTVRHPFELVRLNFHDQREYSCCGYDLKNYLVGIIDESLSQAEG